MEKTPDLRAHTIEKRMNQANKLKEAFSRDDLYTLAEGLYRSYLSEVSIDDPVQRLKQKELLEVIILACPDAQNWLDGINEIEQEIKEE